MIINESEVVERVMSLCIDNKVYQMTADKRGMPNVLYCADDSKWFIHSSYDAVKDGEHFAGTCYNSAKDLAVFGLGLGYHIKSLIARLVPGQKLFIFETNLFLLKIALESAGIMKYLQMDNVFLYAGSSLNEVMKYLVDCLYQGVNFVIYPSAANTVPHNLNLIRQYLQIFTIKYAINKTTTPEDLKNVYNYTPKKRVKKYKVLLLEFSSDSLMIKSFTDNWQLAFEYLGCEVKFLPRNEFIELLNHTDCTPLINLITSYDFIITCNNAYLDAPLYDVLNVPIITIGVDRPFAFSAVEAIIRNGIKNVIYTWTNQNDLEYAGFYYDHGIHRFLPHGAEINFDPASVFAHERVIDVLVSCNHLTGEDTGEFTYNEKPGNEEMINEISMIYKTSGKHLEDCVKDFLGDNCDDEALFQIMREIGYIIENKLRLEKRYRVVKALLEGGFYVHLFGLGWDITDVISYPNCIYHGYVQCESGREIFQRCKVLVNILPYHTSSLSHERVFSSMIRGALCVTDATEYLKNTFKEGEEIVFYHNNDLDELVEKVRYYLSNEDERLQITKNAFKNVHTNHTWINRADEMIDMFEEFNNTMKR